MLSLETESSLTRLLLNFADSERAIEVSRQVLDKNLNFDPYQVFCVIDKEAKNSIDAVNLVDFLKQNSINVILQDAELLVLFYDADSDGALSYCEFLNMILSDSNYSLRKLARDRVGLTRPKQVLLFNVEYSIAKLLEKELDLVKSTRGLIEVIRARYDYSPHDLYHLLKGYGAITQESLRIFLNRNKVNASFDDIKAIMKRLDFNRDGRVDFKEFHCLLTYPLCFHCSCYHLCCILSRHSSPLRDNKSSGLNQPQSIGDWNTITDQKGNYPLEGTNRFESSSQRKDIRKVSPNLALRQSPERKYSPRKANEFRESLTQSSQLQSHHHHSSLYKPMHSHTSPLRCNNKSIECHKRCCVCHCHPCSCCIIAYEKGEKVFLSYLREMMAIESIIEKAKIDLALRADFNVEDAFRIFESNGRGYITESDLKFGLSQLDIFSSHTDLKLLMRRVDLRKEEAISYGAFFDLVTPFDKNYRSMVEKRNQSAYSSPYNKADVFILGTKITLQTLLKLVISSENKLESMKCGLREAREQLKNVFAEIARGGCTFNDIDLASYLRNKDIFATDKESGLAFIRIDRIRTGKVELWNLSEELTTLV